MNILKRILLPLLLPLFLICSLKAKDLTPTKELKLSGGSTDMVLANNQLYVSTAMGKVDIFDAKTKNYKHSISISSITDFAGDIIESKIYSVDVLNKVVLIVSQGQKGGRDISIYKDSKLQNIISADKRMFIARAKFVSENKIIFSTLANQLYLYDIKEKKEIYNQQISPSSFSYFVLNENKSSVIIADESGDLKVVDVKSGNTKTILKDQNLDNIYQVDWKNDTIITAGKDRRSVLYSADNLQPYIRKSSFLIYGCALNRNGKLAAYSSDEENSITIFNTQSKKDLYTLTNNKMTVSKILFLSDNGIFVGTDDKTINFYKLQ